MNSKTTKLNKVKLIKGKKIEDKRGNIRFSNSFVLNKYKRFYQIDLPKKGMIRAFHGHMQESKAVFPISGSLLLCVVNLDNPIKPSRKNKVRKFILDSNQPSVIEIPPKYANGIMSLEKNTRVIFFSDKTLDQSKKDDYRFSKNYWGDIWNEKD